MSGHSAISFTVLDSDGNSFDIPVNVKNSDGTGYGLLAYGSGLYGGMVINETYCFPRVGQSLYNTVFRLKNKWLSSISR